jgi:2-polyprenyl-3-methyl-5-hydroxy-6-metoxy-1,4-benzoquinol methylase
MKNIKMDEYIKGGTQKDFYNEHDREACNCLLCDKNDFVVLGEERGLSVVKCNNCDLIYTNPRPKNVEENYFGDGSLFFEEARLIFNGKKVHHRDKNYEYELRQIKKHKAAGKLLDIGTNMGFFLRKAREFGYEVEGVEPSPSLTKIAVEQWNLNVHNAYFEDANLPKHAYDVITLIDVFEHVTNPKELLTTCLNHLKDDGIVVIKVPNGDYNHFKMKLAAMTGKTASMDIWDCYEHVGHYTPKTMEKMADVSGFKIKDYFIPIPINSPIWSDLVAHYYQYPSPAILDWKRVLLRSFFYRIGTIERLFGGKIRFGPDLMFILRKK